MAVSGDVNGVVDEGAQKGLLRRGMDQAFRLLLRAAEAAHFLGLSRSELYRLDASGRLPAPVRLGKVKRWSRPELEKWVERGCPPRHDWERRGK